MATTAKNRVIEVENMVEERANSTMTQIQEVGRKSVFASLGMWRMIYDGALNTVDRSKQFFGEAVERGEGVEKQAMENAKEFTNMVEERASKMQETVRSNFRRYEDDAETVVSNGKNGLDSRIESALQRLNVPTRANIVELNAKLDALSKKIDEALGTQAEVITNEPMPGYDTMTAKEIVSKLNKLTINELVAVKQYEMAHEDRVTVTREVDRRIEAMPIARYDALTVDEIEPMLSTLETAELQKVAEYEANHENRVTLLRAIESELEERKTAVA